MGKTKAWQKAVSIVLSVVLVFALAITPMLLSALSLLRVDTITEIMTKTISRELLAVQDQKNPVKYVMNNLPEDLAESEELERILEDILAEDISDDAIEEIEDSELMAEFVEIYTEDLNNALSGKKSKSRLDEKKLKSMVNKNMDELLDIAKEMNPKLTKSDLYEMRATITNVVDENAADIIGAIPQPKELKKEMTRNVPGMEILLDILVNKNLYTALIIGFMILLSAGIFLCLLQDFRGFRCLAVDLFIGGGINAIVCVALSLAASLILNEISTTVIASAVDAVLGTLNVGMIVRTTVMLLSGGLLLTAYIVINNLRAKKAPVTMEEI